MNLLRVSLLGGAGFRSVEALLADLTLSEAQREGWCDLHHYPLAGLLAHLNASMRVSLDSRRAHDILLDLARPNAYHWGRVALVRQQCGHHFSFARET